MINKSKAHHYWKAIRRPSLFVIVAGFVLFSALSIYGLRINNTRMLELKQAVFTADEQNGDIEAALQNLRNHVNSHMNTQLRAPDATEPPIQLVNQFNRYVQAEQLKLANQDTNKVYQDAQARCETGAIPLTARAQCIQEYIIANGGNAPQLSLPPKELYTFDFASPKWSPDLAGISIVLAITFFILLVIRLIVGRYMKRELQ